jgi:hypothetical protein
LELQPVRYDYFLGAGSMVRPGDLLSFNAMRFACQIAAPVGPSGIAMRGDIGNFVSLGKKRFSALADDGAVNIAVKFADGESHRILTGYSPAPVTVSATVGQTNLPYRDPSTGLFRVRWRAARTARGHPNCSRARGQLAFCPVREA